MGFPGHKVVASGRPGDRLALVSGLVGDAATSGAVNVVVAVNAIDHTCAPGRLAARQQTRYGDECHGYEQTEGHDLVDAAAGVPVPTRVALVRPAHRSTYRSGAGRSPRVDARVADSGSL